MLKITFWLKNPTDEAHAFIVARGIMDERRPNVYGSQIVSVMTISKCADPYGSVQYLIACVVSRPETAEELNTVREWANGQGLTYWSEDYDVLNQMDFRMTEDESIEEEALMVWPGNFDFWNTDVGERAAGRIRVAAIDVILKRITDTGGATVDARTLNLIDYDTGYQVSMVGREKVHDLTTEARRSLGAATFVEEYLKEYQGIGWDEVERDYYGRRPSVGFWIYEGKIYGDLSIHVDKFEMAMTIGRANSQKAIYDWSTGESIPVDEVKE